MLTHNLVAATQDEDHLALAAACAPGVGLCKTIGIELSFSRRLGAQIAVLADGTTIGNFADGCLENQLAAEMARGGPKTVGCSSRKLLDSNAPQLRSHRGSVHFPKSRHWRN